MKDVRRVCSDAQEKEGGEEDLSSSSASPLDYYMTPPVSLIFLEFF